MKNDRDAVKDSLRGAGVNEAELNIVADKIFDLANILFERYLADKKKIYEKRKI